MSKIKDYLPAGFIKYRDSTDFYIYLRIQKVGFFEAIKRAFCFFRVCRRGEWLESELNEKHIEKLKRFFRQRHKQLKCEHMPTLIFKREKKTTCIKCGLEFPETNNTTGD